MLLAVSIVAMIAVVVLTLASNRGVEGALLYGTKTMDYQDYCTDDDPEDDFYVVGTVKMGPKAYIDHCDGNDLHQPYCSTGKMVKQRRHYECPNGCKDGACLRG